jgi:hypothetical protein
MRIRSGVVECEVDDMCLCCTKCAVPVGLVGWLEGPTKFLFVCYAKTLNSLTAVVTYM